MVAKKKVVFSKKYKNKLKKSNYMSYLNVLEMGLSRERLEISSLSF